MAVADALGQKMKTDLYIYIYIYILFIINLQTHVLCIILKFKKLEI